MTDTRNQYLEKIISCAQPFVKDGFELKSDTNLMDEAGLDSASMVNILMQLETVLGINLSAADLTFDHFRSCETLAEYFANK